MNILRFQGWALIVSASIHILLLMYTGPFHLFLYDSEILLIASSILFMLGLPGIQEVQPQTKYWGQIGLFLMAIPALDQLITSLASVTLQYPLDINQKVSLVWRALTSVGLLYMGYIITGWVTIRARKFPTWVGWLLFIAGIITSIILLPVTRQTMETVSMSSLSSLFTVLRFLEAAAVLGYGWNILQYKEHGEKRIRYRTRSNG